MQLLELRRELVSYPTELLDGLRLVGLGLLFAKLSAQRRLFRRCKLP
jgi:hypothetical protein